MLINCFQGDFDSDQNISDEDDFSGENCASPTGNPQNKEGLQLQSRLELLRGEGLSTGGCRDIDFLTAKNHTISFDEDEVEIPDFPEANVEIFSPKRDDLCNLDEHVVSDDEIGQDGCAVPNGSIAFCGKNSQKGNCHQVFGSTKPNAVHLHSMISDTVGALIHANECALSSIAVQSKAKQSSKGVKIKAKPKFSFRSRSDGVRLSQPFFSKEESAASSDVQGIHGILRSRDLSSLERPKHKLLQHLHRGTKDQMLIAQTEAETLEDDLVEHSMSELLDGLQDKSTRLRENYDVNMISSDKGGQLVMKRKISLDRVHHDEGEFEPVTSGSSSDDESNYRTLKLANPEMNGRSMADRFQEALANSALTKDGPVVGDLKPSGFGLFGKLQQVMQSEKERDANFIKKLQMRASPNGPHSFIVKILSKYLEARLTVCRCSLLNNIDEASHNPETLQTLADREIKRTVIFSPRVCGDVDLDVGNFVNVHFPWKEVQVKANEEIIILSTYFSSCSA